MAHHPDHNVEIMTDCHDICLQTVSHCLEKGGDHARTEHVTLLLDCAEICQTAANFMLRNSSYIAASARSAPKFATAAPRTANSRPTTT